MIDYVWKRGKRVANDAEMWIDLVATSSSSEKVLLNRLQYNKASEMLEVWIVPGGNNNNLYMY